MTSPARFERTTVGLEGRSDAKPRKGARLVLASAGHDTRRGPSAARIALARQRAEDVAAWARSEAGQYLLSGDVTIDEPASHAYKRTGLADSFAVRVSGLVVWSATFARSRAWYGALFVEVMLRWVRPPRFRRGARKALGA